MWSRSDNVALLLIPEEAECVIKMIRAKGEATKVHLIAHAAPITRNMLHFDDLSYYALPPVPAGYKFPSWLTIELGIFSGRLYLSFPGTKSLKAYLGVRSGSGEVDPGHQRLEEDVGACAFVKNPMAFLPEWLALRRKTQDVVHTPMGYILQGRPLHESHPFFMENTTAGQESAGSLAPSGTATGLDEDGTDDDEDSGSDNEWPRHG